VSPRAAASFAHSTNRNATSELYVKGHRVAEADVTEALSMLGDEQVQACRDGRLPRAEAYRIERNRYRTIAGMISGRLHRSAFWRES
jgi:hypothetical protein